MIENKSSKRADEKNNGECIYTGPVEKELEDM